MRNMIGIGLVALAFAACGGSSAPAGPSNQFNATLNGANETPPNTTTGSGTAGFTVTGGTVTYTVTYTGLTGNATAGHIHTGVAGVKGDVVVAFTTVPAAPAGTISGSFTAADVKATVNGGTIAAGDFNALLAAMRAGAIYANIHTAANPGGEIRGQLRPQ